MKASRQLRLWLLFLNRFPAHQQPSGGTTRTMLLSYKRQKSEKNLDGLLKEFPNLSTNCHKQSLLAAQQSTKPFMTLSSPSLYDVTKNAKIKINDD